MEMCSLAHAVTKICTGSVRYKQTHICCQYIQLTSVLDASTSSNSAAAASMSNPSSGLHQAFWYACCSAFAAWAACASPSVSGTACWKLLCLLASACSQLHLAASCLVFFYAAAWQVHLAGMAHAGTRGRHGIRMDPTKTAGVSDWPVPRDVHHL